TVTARQKKPHPPHPLARKIERAPGGIRVAGISTTNMDEANPRYSTSDALLEVALDHAKDALKCETRLIRLSALKFRNCEGYYSKSASACTWPCSITQMDDKDELTAVYEALVHWADVVLVSTPIRWGVASALYFKMAERLNCIQNQITIRDSVLIRRKVAAFVITGGQDNVQGVAGEMLCFFSELGFHFPQFPYIAHSRGWSAEDMERNVEHVMKSAELRTGAMELAGRAVELAKTLLATAPMEDRTPRGGRNAYRLEIERAYPPARKLASPLNRGGGKANMKLKAASLQTNLRAAPQAAQQRAYRSVRAVSEALVAPLTAEDAAAQSMPDASPAKWHLAHTTWFFETFVLEAHAPRRGMKYAPFDPAFRVLFNSYYNAIGEKHPRPERGMLTRPSLERVLEYRAHVDEHLLQFLKGNLSEEASALVELGLHHEQQHQELLLTDVKHLLSRNPLLPAYHKQWPRTTIGARAPGWLAFGEGLHEIGHAGDGFAFDNETP